jgi:hypothetical protein
MYSAQYVLGTGRAKDREQTTDVQRNAYANVKRDFQWGCPSR